MRDPSLHITKSHFTKAMRKAEQEGIIPDGSAYILVKYMFGKHNYSNANNRSILVSNAKIEKKVQTLLLADKDDTKLMANLVYHFRLNLRHRGITPIKPTSRDWDVVKKVTELAIRFSNDYEFKTKREGFLKFLEIGSSKMAKFSLIKYLGMGESIWSTYEALETIKKDKHAALTKTIHDLFVRHVFENTGILSEYDKNPEKYVYFCKVSELCKTKGIDYRDYITSQFNGMGFKNSYPDPIQLIGDKANERLNKYLFENKIKVNQVQQTIDWSKIKQK